MLTGCIHYIHMGKTGGGSIAKWLRSVFNPEECFQGDFDGSLRLTGMATYEPANKALLQMNNDKRESLKLAIGHLPFNLLHNLPKPVKCVTVVREPIDRELSSFYYLKTVGGERGEYFKKLSLTDFANHIAVADNYQVRVLSGLDELNPIWNANETYPSIQGRLDILELAKENIKKHFAAVGLFESLDQFAITLGQLISCKLTPQLDKVNVTSYRLGKNDISHTELDILKSKVDLDLALYEWIKEIA